MAGNKNLNKAKDARNDEFYTQLNDIENELKHYKKHFEDKIVLCNCDDPYESNFFKFFAINFNHLKLKKLIATSYATSPIVYTQLNIFGEEEILGIEEGKKKSYKIEITKVEDENQDGTIDLYDVEYLIKNDGNVLKQLEGNGDFRSEECIELLKQADIVVTNPPFSLFREYVAQLIEYDKKFLVMGNMNAIHYKEIFPLIKDNKVWAGYSFNKTMVFKMPENYAGDKRDEFGNKIAKVPAIIWLTNLETSKRHEELILFKQYNAAEYPKYENYEAINVDKVADIPCDYYEYMGVPDSFLESYNPEQFEIIGLGSGTLGQSIGVGGIDPEHKKLMKGHSAAGDLYYMQENGLPRVPYSRIIIKRK